MWAKKIEGGEQIFSNASAQLLVREDAPNYRCALVIVCTTSGSEEGAPARVEP
jgi:hypothetical protein